MASDFTIDVQHKGDQLRGLFFVEKEGREIATLSYVFAGDNKFIIEYTEVHPSFGGLGIGKKLVQAAVDFARTNHYKIIPLCPYAKAILGKTSAYQDVLFQ
jgi:predicted GNAT family acetyltransferase